MQSPPPPPAFVDPPKSPSRFSARRVGLALAALVVVAALSFFIVDDLGQRADVHTLQDRVASVRASASAQQTSDQATIAALQGLIPTEPDFVLAGSGWQGACTSDSCTPDASFINRGKAGEAVATFNIYGGSTSTGSMLASCTAALPIDSRQWLRRCHLHRLLGIPPDLLREPAIRHGERGGLGGESLRLRPQRTSTPPGGLAPPGPLGLPRAAQVRMARRSADGPGGPAASSRCTSGSASTISAAELVPIRPAPIPMNA